MQVSRNESETSKAPFQGEHDISRFSKAAQSPDQSQQTLDAVFHTIEQILQRTKRSQTILHIFDFPATHDDM